MSKKRRVFKTESSSRSTWRRFEAKLEYLRQQMKIPGLSAAIVMDQELVWAKGFGYADLENRIEAAPDTLYHLASVTKTLAATLVMQLVEQGAISLDDPVSQYGVELQSQGTILVRHLLTHTSTGIPGTRYIYDGDRYASLGQIVERVTGKTFGTLLQERILGPLGMTNTWMNYPPCAIALGQSPYPIDWNASAIQTAKPYQLDPSYEVVEGAYYPGFSPGAGLISTVVDLARFDIALDRNVFLKQETRAAMLAPAVSIYPGRTDLMHGLGWFAQAYRGTHLNWHAGRWPPSVSANYIKVPEENLSFIIMANTAHLNTPPPHGDIMYSTLGLAFYETLVYPRRAGQTIPEVNWEASERDLVDRLKRVADSDVREVVERELWAYRQLFASVGKSELADQLLNVHRQVFPGSSPSRLDLYTFRGVAYSPPVVGTDQVQLTEAELVRVAGAYLLSDPKANAADLPLEIRLGAIRGELFAAFTGGCIDLIAVTPTRFTAPDRGVSIDVQVNGKEVERVTVHVDEVEAVYVPKE